MQILEGGGMSDPIEKLLAYLGELTRAIEKYSSNKQKDKVYILLDEIKEYMLGNEEFFDKYLSSLETSENIKIENKVKFIEFEKGLLNRYHASNLARNELKRSILSLKSKNVSSQLDISNTKEFIQLLELNVRDVLDQIDKSRGKKKGKIKQEKLKKGIRITISMFLMVANGTVSHSGIRDASIAVGAIILDGAINTH